MGSPSSSAQTASQQQTTMRCVRFKPYASLIKVPHPDVAPMEEDDDESSTSSSWGLWYSKEEMSSLARADVSAFVAAHQSGITASAATTVADDSDDCMDCESQVETQTQICGRGLEMYLPGQLVLLRRRRKAYQEAALRKQQALLTLCGKKGSNEIANRLEQFLKIRSQESVDKARELGVQDAADAGVIHQESNAHMNDSSDSDMASATTIIGNKRKAVFPCDQLTVTNSKSPLGSPSTSTLMTKQAALPPTALFSHHAIPRVA